MEYGISKTGDCLNSIFHDGVPHTIMLDIWFKKNLNNNI
jgi:hypothetical protein